MIGKFIAFAIRIPLISTGGIIGIIGTAAVACGRKPGARGLNPIVPSIPGGGIYPHLLQEPKLSLGLKVQPS